MQRTRRVILDLLKRRGEATLDDLAQEAGVVSMTARAHLSVLERDGLVSFREERGKIGRPRFVYSLTEQALDHFPKSYHTLCNRILDAVSSCSGGVSQSEVTDRVADMWAGDHVERLQGKSLEERVHLMATIRTEEGAMASVEKTAEGFLLHQCHCPASCVATRHPDVVCEAELGYIRRVVGAPVERVRWMVQGAETCSYRISAASEADPASPSPTSA